VGGGDKGGIVVRAKNLGHFHVLIHHEPWEKICTNNEAGRQLTSAELPARLEKSSVVEESI